MGIVSSYGYSVRASGKIKAMTEHGVRGEVSEVSRENRKVCDNVKGKFVHWLRPLSVSCSAIPLR